MLTVKLPLAESSVWIPCEIHGEGPLSNIGRKTLAMESSEWIRLFIMTVKTLPLPDRWEFQLHTYNVVLEIKDLKTETPHVLITIDERNASYLK